MPKLSTTFTGSYWRQCRMYLMVTLTGEFQYNCKLITWRNIHQETTATDPPRRRQRFNPNPNTNNYICQVKSRENISTKTNQYYIEYFVLSFSPHEFGKLKQLCCCGTLSLSPPQASSKIYLTRGWIYHSLIITHVTIVYVLSQNTFF